MDPLFCNCAYTVAGAWAPVNRSKLAEMGNLCSYPDRVVANLSEAINNSLVDIIPIEQWGSTPKSDLYRRFDYTGAHRRFARAGLVNMAYEYQI